MRAETRRQETVYSVIQGAQASFESNFLRIFFSWFKLTFLTKIDKIDNWVKIDNWIKIV